MKKPEAQEAEGFDEGHADVEWPTQDSDPGSQGVHSSKRHPVTSKTEDPGSKLGASRGLRQAKGVPWVWSKLRVLLTKPEKISRTKNWGGKSSQRRDLQVLQTEG